MQIADSVSPEQVTCKFPIHNWALENPIQLLPKNPIRASMVYTNRDP